MSSVLLAAAGGFVRPDIDWHALAPELVILATLVICLLIDVFTEDGVVVRRHRHVGGRGAAAHPAHA